jgi:hypothetical protein
MNKKIPTREDFINSIYSSFSKRNQYDAELARSLKIKPINIDNSVEMWMHRPAFSMELSFKRDFAFSSEVLFRDPSAINVLADAAYFTILRKITEVTKDHIIGSSEPRSVPLLPFKIIVDPYITDPGTIIVHPTDYIRMMEAMYKN